jgi:hypothetical protein
MALIAKAGTLLCVAGLLAYAETLTGTLLDASCYDGWSTTQATRPPDHNTKSKLDKECAPAASTTSFVIQTPNNKVYKLDRPGSDRASENIRNGSIKPDNDGDIHVSVSGSVQGNTMKVGSIHQKQESH